ncbi:hypothetical protein CP02DC14_2288, partial [Chlamydia psittaci 02DC14]
SGSITKLIKAIEIIEKLVIKIIDLFNKFINIMHIGNKIAALNTRINCLEKILTIYSLKINCNFSLE